LVRITDVPFESKLKGGTTGMADSPGGAPVSIEKGRVIAVDIKGFTVDVRTEHTFKSIPDVPFMVPYCHPAQGEGINVMPEVGSSCWICYPSDNQQKPFVLGWGMTDEAGSYRAGRELLNPGDLHFSGRDGNFIFIRRGGIIQIGATPICQTIYLPIRNILQQFCENYELHSPGGDLTWTVNRSDEDINGHKGTTFMLAAHEYADDPIKDPLAVLKVGSHGDGNPTILTLQTRDKGGGAVQTELKIDKTGELQWVIQKAVTYDFKDNFTVLVQKNFAVWANQDATLKADANVNLEAPNVAIKAGATTAAFGSAGASIGGPAVNLGDALFQVILNSTGFVQWMGQVTAAVNALAPGAVTPPSDHISTKVKA
jgi:hypothetical protein